MVKWFNGVKGFGFIAPDAGGEDLFVHQTSICSDSFRTLAEGDAIEFAIKHGNDGRSKAVDIIVPRGFTISSYGGGRGREYSGDRGKGVEGYGGGYGGGYGSGGGGYGRGWESGGRGGGWATMEDMAAGIAVVAVVVVGRAITMGGLGTWLGTVTREEGPGSGSRYSRSIRVRVWSLKSRSIG